MVKYKFKKHKDSFPAEQLSVLQRLVRQASALWRKAYLARDKGRVRQYRKTLREAFSLYRKLDALARDYLVTVYVITQQGKKLSYGYGTERRF